MDYFFVTLKGFPADEGEVIAKDERVIGAYTCDDDDYCEFRPNDSEEVVVAGYHVGPFCREIAEWLQKQES